MADLFRCFEDLASTQIEGVDFTRFYRSGCGDFVVMAPHGGGIEFMTAPLARAIGGSEHAVYCFEGCKKGGGNRCLHITSTNFDEPIALEVASSHRYVIAIHGAREDDESWTMVGGLADDLRDTVVEALEAGGFLVQPCDAARGARSPENICNRGRDRGVQLELSASLRCALKDDAGEKLKYVNAVRSALSGFVQRHDV